MKKRIIWTLVGLVAVAAVAIQWTNPRLTNPPEAPGRDLLASNPPPADIVNLLQGACYDCHSYQTKWPWYSHVAPVSWWLVDHVNHGRRRLNFSHWPNDDARTEAKRWRHIRDEVKSGDMPLWSYTLMHPAARLSPEQRDRLVKWAGEEAHRLQPDVGN
jgi:Haem-binding domain